MLRSEQLPELQKVVAVIQNYRNSYRPRQGVESGSARTASCPTSAIEMSSCRSSDAELGSSVDSKRHELQLEPFKQISCGSQLVLEDVSQGVVDTHTKIPEASMLEARKPENKESHTVSPCLSDPEAGLTCASSTLPAPDNFPQAPESVTGAFEAATSSMWIRRYDKKLNRYYFSNRALKVTTWKVDSNSCAVMSIAVSKQGQRSYTL